MLDIIYSFSPLSLSLWGFIIGMCIGSYMNVVAYRIPIEIKNSWIKDSLEILEYLEFKISVDSKNDLAEAKDFSNEKRSFCPSCNKLIPFYFNIPIFGWIFLRGVSACCNNKISARYLFVESFFAISFALFFYFFSIQNALIVSFSLSILYAISAIDLKIKIIPDPLVYVFLWSGLIYSSLLNHENSYLNLLYVSGTYLSIYLLNFVVKSIKGFDVIGMGDAKLLAAATAWLGIYGACWVFILSPFFFLFFSIYFKKREMAFGPSISIAIIILMILNIGLGYSLNPYLY